VNCFTNLVGIEEGAKAHALGQRPFGAQVVVLQVDRAQLRVTLAELVTPW